MNYKIEKEINDRIITEQNDKTFNDFITDFSKQNKKTFYNLIKDNIYKKYADVNNTYNHIAKMLDLELLDFTFKHLNDHQLKIYIFNSDYINKINFTAQIEEYKKRFVKQDA